MLEKYLKILEKHKGSGERKIALQFIDKQAKLVLFRTCILLSWHVLATVQKLSKNSLKKHDS